jgi:methionine sulfoxide reductase heme-binding subunit
VSNQNPLWYTTRASGTVSLVLLTAVIVLGILVSIRWNNGQWSNYLVQAAHRYLSLMALVFLALHISTAVIDPFAHLKITDAIVPFSSSYRSFWLGLGVVAVDILIALVVTSLLRGRIGFRFWRVFHWLAYACWPIALLHGMGTGTDTRTLWGLGLDVVCVAAVLCAIGVRIAYQQHRSVANGVLIPLVGVGTIWLAVWAISGPLQDGWARAAGTPTNLLAASSAGTSSSNPSTSVSPSPSSSSATVPVGLRDQLQGSQGQTSGGLAELQLSDTTNPGISVTLSDPGDGSGNLLFALINNGATVCSATVPGSSDRISVPCHGVTVSLRIGTADNGGVVGTLTTTAGGA